MSEPIIALIAALANNDVIGAGGRLPWHAPADLKRFRDQTLGKPVIMGLTTYRSLPAALTGRDLIVVSHDDQAAAKNVVMATSISDALRIARQLASRSKASEIMIAGGAQIYRQTIGLATRLYITRILIDVDGDARFPSVNPSQWAVTARRDHPGAPPLIFLTYERIGTPA
jgi:dihydrofolate reductase